MIPHAFAFTQFVQEQEFIIPSLVSLSCNPMTVTKGNLLIFDISYQTPSLTHITSVSDDIGTVFTKIATTLTTGSHPINSSTWIGVLPSSGSEDAVVHLSASADIGVACSEWTNVSNTVITIKTATGTSVSPATNFPLAVASFTPNIGNLIYAFGSGDPCGGTGTPLIHSDSFTPAGANPLTNIIEGVCRTLGAVQFKFSFVDEYSIYPSSTLPTTVPIQWSFATQQGVNNGDWSEIVIELKTPSIFINTDNDGLYVIGLFLIVLFGLSLSYRKTTK